jgi:hypothetical protein
MGEFVQQAEPEIIDPIVTQRQPNYGGSVGKLERRAVQMRPRQGFEAHQMNVMLRTLTDAILAEPAPSSGIPVDFLRLRATVRPCGRPRRDPCRRAPSTLHTLDDEGRSAPLARCAAATPSRR